MKHFTDFLIKTLTSRKFWAAVAAAIPLALAGAWTDFATVWMAYAGIQGGVDAVAAIKGPRPTGQPDAATPRLTIPDSGPVGPD